MKRNKLIAMLLAAALCAALLCGCSPSPTAVTVGGRKVDASEYAFYLYYNRPDASASGTVVYDDAVMASVRQAALDQIRKARAGHDAERNAECAPALACKTCDAVLFREIEERRFHGRDLLHLLGFHF